MLQGKKIIILGDRDGIPGQAIEECVKSIPNTEVLFATTICTVWTSAGAMDLEVQKRIKELAEKFGAQNLVLLLGANEAEGSGLVLETVTAGDPAYAGSLSGVQLGVPCYHVCEEPIKSQIDPKVYEDQVSMMEMVLPVDAIVAEMNRLREQFKDLIKV